MTLLKTVPRYCRVMRVMREIPPEYIVAGTIRIDLRREVEAELRRKRSKLKEIRYREIGFALRDKKEGDKDINLDLRLKTTKYKASGGTEYFLEVVNKDDILFGLLRLRINGDKKTAIVRELHVYGKSLRLGQTLKFASQHQGLGTWLLEEAESIVKKHKLNKLSIISGIGVREYYKKFGYKLSNSYMVKKI